MKTYCQQRSLDVISFLRDKLNFQPNYQRNPVWGLQRKQALIDSIFRGYDIPKIYFEVITPPTTDHEFNVICHENNACQDATIRGYDASNLDVSC